MIELRPYQTEVIAKAAQSKRPLLCLPTGSGKTVIASEIIRLAENKHVVFLAHRRELIHQTRDKLAEFDVAAGVLLAQHPTDHTLPVQVASVQTLWSRCFRQTQDLPPANIVFVDEAHHVRARTYQQILAAYPDAQVIGMTATPCRRDGRGLGNVFDELIEGPSVEELIKLGFLVGTKVYAPSKPNLKGVRTKGGDYVESQLDQRMNTDKLVGDIVSRWLRLGERRKTVCFATTIAHSIHLKDEFVKLGVKAAHLDGDTPKDERDEILQRLSSGELELVSNCMVLTEGWDQPDVSCCILARPTKSTMLYRQMVGRVLRPFAAKDHALILDHAGAVFQHGFVEDPVEWSLDEDRKAETPAQETRQLKPSDRLIECVQCQAIRTAGEPCRHCGYFPRRHGYYHDVQDGHLEELDRNGSSRPQIYTPRERQEFYLGLVRLAHERGNKPGAAAYRYRDKFNEWPPRHWQDMPSMQPTPEVQAWDRHCRIRYAKSMQKAKAA
jgi:superfamily II DNA or RNA helicase